MPTLQLALVALSFALSASAQYSTGRHRGRRIVGGAIAGIVIGCVVALLLLCLCCALLFRRRRARGTGAGQGALGWRRFGAGGPAAQEAGYGHGPGIGSQGGWNTNAQPAYGGGQYQPPAGPPPGGPQPGGFVKPPAAHTRPY
ncbi:hypothetical protein C8Q78DRAFT_1005658 [Trametes maxima]|nr:hypothetical protein C8Q78DRAFT_1005658 [Trametes maxima]